MICFCGIRGLNSPGWFGQQGVWNGAGARNGPGRWPWPCGGAGSLSPSASMGLPGGLSRAAWRVAGGVVARLAAWRVGSPRLVARLAPEFSSHVLLSRAFDWVGVGWGWGILGAGVAGAWGGLDVGRRLAGPRAGERGYFPARCGGVLGECWLSFWKNLFYPAQPNAPPPLRRRSCFVLALSFGLVGLGSASPVGGRAIKKPGGVAGLRGGHCAGDQA